MLGVQTRYREPKKLDSAQICTMGLVPNVAKRFDRCDVWGQPPSVRSGTTSSF
jgi:hypothetical protein